MHCVKLFPRILLGGLLLALGTVLFSACQGNLPTISNQELFTKQKLEKLGTMLKTELVTQYEILPETAPYDTSVYWFTQHLYEQATSNMHRDKQSPATNKWDQGRIWKVYIINNDNECLAFALPGGDFFISTGMLKGFKKDYELYAMFSFEATLMNEGYLMEQWIREYNSLTINNMIEGIDQPNPLTASILAQELTSFVFEPKTVQAVDKEAIENTCNTSILDPVGLEPFLNNPDFSTSKWITTRPSYDGRENLLSKLGESECPNNQLGNVNYQRFVLNILN